MNEEIIIRLKGIGVSPGLIRSSEIAEILESVEDMVVAEAIRNNPNLEKDNIVVGIYAIENKSIGLKFKTTMASIVIPAFFAAAEAVDRNEYNSLTPETLKSLKTISGFSKRHSCNAIIGSSSVPELATITPFTEVPKPSYLEGESEIIGKVIRVGGKTPKAMIELTDGTTIYCQVPEEIAKKLGHSLYKLAKFNGLAKWNSDTLDIEEFKITSVEEFKNQNPNSIFEDLANIIGDQILQIDDINLFSSNLRSEGDLQ